MIELAEEYIRTHPERKLTSSFSCAFCDQNNAVPESITCKLISSIRATFYKKSEAFG